MRSKKRTTRRYLRRKESRRKQRGGAHHLLFVELAHGLGNQLFMYAMGLLLSKKTNTQLCLILKAGKDYRNLMQGTPIHGALVKRSHHAAALTPTYLKFFETVQEKDIKYDAAKQGDVKMGEGYLQDFKPLLPVLTEIKRTMIEREFSKELYTKRIQGLDASCAFMHVRRGDYLALDWRHDDSYYNNALLRLKDCKGLQKIYVVSDDIQWCKEQEAGWKKLVPIHLECIDIPNELEAFWFMMNCTGGAIISASTFSAWAAMLGPNENSTSCIIYPKKNPAFEKLVGGVPPNGGNIYNYPSDWIMV